MDLVFKRYSSPFFLDLCIENSDLGKLVDVLLKKRDEEMLWEMYIASLPYNDKSFKDWKKEALERTKVKQNVHMSKKEIDATIQKSKDILSGFKPPQKGGN